MDGGGAQKPYSNNKTGAVYDTDTIGSLLLFGLYQVLVLVLVVIVVVTWFLDLSCPHKISFLSCEPTWGDSKATLTIKEDQISQ